MEGIAQVLDYECAGGVVDTVSFPHRYNLGCMVLDELALLVDEQDVPPDYKRVSQPSTMICSANTPSSTRMCEASQPQSLTLPLRVCMV